MTYEYTNYCTTINGLEHMLVHTRHLLVAGTTGSGKSVLIQRMLIAMAGEGYNVAICDPKKIDYRGWADCINTIAYANTKQGIADLLERMCAKMDQRYASMTTWQTRYEGSEIWIVVDEFSDLMTYQKGDRADRALAASIEKSCIRIAQLGRAAGIHLLLATQRPTTDVITGRIKTNLDQRVALHCANAQESRNILEQTGAEDLMVGECLFRDGTGAITKYIVPMIDKNEERRCAEYMTAQRWQIFGYPNQYGSVPSAQTKRPGFFKRLFGMA